MAVNVLIFTRSRVSQCTLCQDTVQTEETSDLMHKPEPSGSRGWRQSRTHSGVPGEVFGQPSKGLAIGTASDLQGRRAPEELQKGSWMKESSRDGTFLE